MEDALLRQQEALTLDAGAAVAALRELEAKREERRAEVRQAEAAVQEKQDVVMLKKDALAEATITMTVTKKLVAQKQEEQRVGDADIMSQKKELEGLTAAYDEHFKAP